MSYFRVAARGIEPWSGARNTITAGEMLDKGAEWLREEPVGAALGPIRCDAEDRRFCLEFGLLLEFPASAQRASHSQEHQGGQAEHC